MLLKKSECRCFWIPLEDVRGWTFFAVPFVMGAAGDVSEGEVGEDLRFCSS